MNVNIPSQQTFADAVVKSIEVKGTRAERTGEGVMCGVRLVDLGRHHLITPYTVYNHSAEDVASEILAA